MAARLQGRDEIITARPSERVRPLTADSTLLPRWGPPVSAVELHRNPPQDPKGSARAGVPLPGSHGASSRSVLSMSRQTSLRTSSRRTPSVSGG